MPLFGPDQPGVNAQRRFNRICASVVALGGIALGCWLAYDLTRLPSGYVAAYANFGALVATIFLTAVGVVSLVSRRTQWLGIGLVLAGLLTFVTYVVGARVLVKLGRIPWAWAPPPIHLVAGQHTRVVIYFRNGMSEQQIDDFVASKLPFLPYWSDSRQRLPATEADHRAGVALAISDNAYREWGRYPRGFSMLEENVSAFMVVMRRDSRVSSVELQSRP